MKFEISKEALEKSKAAQTQPEETKPADQEIKVKRVNGELAGIPSYGHELVPSKLLNLYEQGILYLQDKFPGLEITSIMFRDEIAQNLDNEVIGGCFIPETKSIAIYLRSILKINCDRTMEATNQSSVLTNLWLGMLLTMFHEIGHHETMEDEKTVAESFCDGLAEEVLMVLARNFNIEADKNDLGCLTAPLKEWVDGLRETDDRHSQRMVQMYDQGLVWLSDNDDTVRDLKEFLKLVDISTAGEDDPRIAEWQKPVSDAPPVKIYDRAILLGMFRPQAASSPETVVHDNMGGGYPGMAPIGDFDPNPVLEDDMEEYADGPSPASMGLNPGMGSMPFPDAGMGGANYGTYSQPAVQPTPQVRTVPRHNLSPEQVGQCVYQVFMRLFCHIYSKCGFQNTHFANAFAVLEPISIADIPGAREVFVELDTHDANGQPINCQNIWQPGQMESRPAGCLKGRLMKNNSLPAFRLWVNNGDGTLKRVAFLPQNPQKMKNGQLSQWAQAAQAGHRIAMLMVDNPGGGSTLTRKIEAFPGQPLENASYVPVQFNN